jgi:hypothetical protein
MGGNHTHGMPAGHAAKQNPKPAGFGACMTANKTFTQSVTPITTP